MELLQGTETLGSEGASAPAAAMARSNATLAGSAAPPASVGLVLPPAYGWVLVIVLLAVCLSVFLTFNVIRARVRFGVKPPDFYAVKGVTGRAGGRAEDSDETLLRLSARECDVFNCYQRAHQHAVEGFSVFLPLLLAGGLGFPRLSALGGLLFVLGNLAYALGYYTGEPANRRWGSFQLMGLLICFLSTLLFSVQLLWSG